MYYQNAKKVNPFALYGCYFFSLGRIAEKLTHGELTNYQIWEAYVVAVSEAWMDEDCFVKSPQKIIKFFMDLLDSKHGYVVQYVGWWNEDMGEEFFGEETYYNFVVLRDDHGSYNHFYLEDFDPHFGEHPRPSFGLSGKRYFLIQKQE
jgi:hypothetical protein